MKSAVYCASVVAACLISIPAGAQSLALSYKLDTRSQPAREAAAVAPRCSGLNWITAIEACGRDLLARMAPERIAPEAPRAELPTLGSGVPTPVLRSGGNREALIGSTRTADFLLRLGSKYRLRSDEQGNWSYYRFTDTTYESFIKNKGHKAVGVELLVPFD